MPCLIPDYADTPNPAKPLGRVLFIGLSYYNNFYLSRELRKLGWKADVLFSVAEGAEEFSHGYDFFLRDTFGSDNTGVAVGVGKFKWNQWLLKQFARAGFSLPGRFCQAILRLTGITWPRRMLSAEWERFCQACRSHFPDEAKLLFGAHRDYDIIHFSGINSMRFLFYLNPTVFGCMPVGWDIQFLRLLGRKTVYTNIGCFDGVSQTSFRRWGPSCVCDICRWKNEPGVCGDERNLAWGKLRNACADYQVTLGGNRVDCNADPRVHEVPEFYCLDPQVWRPDLHIPAEFKQAELSPGTVRLFHAVGNYQARTDEQKVNIKSTHIYVPLIEELKRQGYPVELMFVSDAHSKDMRFHQVQADLHLDMLTFGWFGATAREMMMLGKPVICYLRPEWLASVAQEIPDYVRELPIVQATPETVRDVLLDLVAHCEKRQEIGRRSREFAVKWHSSAAGARRMVEIYARLLRYGKG